MFILSSLWVGVLLDEQGEFSMAVSVLKRRVGVLTTALVVASGLAFFPAAAQADSGNTDDLLTSSEVAQAVAKASTNGDVLTAVASTQNATDAAVVTTNGVTVEIPKNAQAGINLTGSGIDLTISLPNAEDAATAHKTVDGKVIYPSNNGSANTVIPTATGVQMLTTIANAQAPERYTYDVSTTAGDVFTIFEDGSAILAGADGTAKIAVPTPWAKDANGHSIPTHFETDGTSLTQVIEHTSAQNVAYPVTADPGFGVVALIGLCAGSAALAWIFSSGNWQDRAKAAVGGCLISVFGWWWVSIL